MAEPVRQISFHNHLLVKLSLIVWAAGGKNRAQRKLGVARETFFRWFRPGHFPQRSRLNLIDDAYAAAFEKRSLHEKRLEQRRKRDQARRVREALHNSVDAI